MIDTSRSSGGSPVPPAADQDAALAAVRDVGGWLGPDEGRLLYRLAAGADPAGAIVEIGSWHGKSTIWLAYGARAGRGARVTAIDPHRGTNLRDEGETTEPILRANLKRAGVSDRVDVVVATSEEAEAGWTTAVSFLWIDGDHSYEGALRDLDLWERHLLPGAAVAFHDTFTFPGPERVFRERVLQSGDYSGFAWAETTSAARRAPPRSLLERCEHWTAIARRSLYGIRVRAYDRNTVGFASVRDALARRER
jgi:predicted O-methyltransferase YrrM